MCMRDRWARLAAFSKEKLPRGKLSNLIRKGAIEVLRNFYAPPNLDLEMDRLQLNLSPSPKTASNKILITGSTGYIGIFTLQEALKDNDLVYCLVRATSQEHGYKRLKQTAEKFGLEMNIDELREKIVIVLGDCKKKSFGLRKEIFDEIGLVIHCAMSVTYFEPYELFKQAWIVNFVDFANSCVERGIEMKVLGSVLWRAVDDQRGYWSNGYARVAKMKKDISMKYAENGCHVTYYDLGFPAPPIYTSGYPQISNIVLAMLAVGVDLNKWHSGAVVPTISVDILARLLMMPSKKSYVSAHTAVLDVGTTRKIFSWDSIGFKPLMKVMQFSRWPKVFIDTMNFESMDLNGGEETLDIEIFGLNNALVTSDTLAKIFDAAKFCSNYFKDGTPIVSLGDFSNQFEA